MSTFVAIDWNAWRTSYDELTVADQRDFYDRIYDEFPEQARASVKSLERFLAYIPERPLYVVELGGWDGGLAASFLARHPELFWTNYEISARAVEESVCDDPRYNPVALGDWYWSKRRKGDLFVASHVLEHLTWRDVLATFDATDCRYLYLQAPLKDDGTDWTDYRGSHILAVGWGDIYQALDERGYDLLEDLTTTHVRCFERRA